MSIPRGIPDLFKNEFRHSPPRMRAIILDGRYLSYNSEYPVKDDKFGQLTTIEGKGRIASAFAYHFDRIGNYQDVYKVTSKKQLDEIIASTIDSLKKN
jgi:hypothetical protein